MMRSFPIKAGFVVGIYGGVWSEKKAVRLGDAIVSQPAIQHCLSSDRFGSNRA